MSCFIPQVSFSLNFASLFIVIRNNSSARFQLKLYMIFTKRVHQSSKFQTSDCSGEISSNFYFNRFFLLKYIKCQLKKYRGVMSHDTEEWSKIWRKTTLFRKWQEFGEFWSEHSKVFRIRTLIGLFCAKYITLDLKTYRGITFHGTEESGKIWRKTDLWFGKWHEGFGKFSSEHLKV